MLVLRHVTKYLSNLLLVPIACVLVSGCAYLYAPMPGMAEDNIKILEAWDPQSEVSEDLRALPAPDNAIVVSVFSFRDQTGQYKAAPANAFSTAVTQGGTAMLLNALVESRWFMPLEREGLQNLLTERKILRAIHGDNALPPLLGARIVIEGGIIGYDSTTLTGGIGAKYLGTASYEKYRVDALTITLRAIDTTTGGVIHTVTVRKKIYAKAISPRIFRTVKFKRLFEIEGGMTENDPMQIVLKDAIDTAIIRLIVTGLAAKSWQLQDNNDLESAVLLKYATLEQKLQLQSMLGEINKTRLQSESFPKKKDRSVVIVLPPDESKPSAPPLARVSDKPIAQPVSMDNQKVSKVPKVVPQDGGGVAADYSIQLASSDSLEALLAFTELWSLNPAHVRYVKVQDYRPGRNKVWYTLQYGSYASTAAATAALIKMPDEIKLMQPWVTQRAKFFEIIPVADSSRVSQAAEDHRVKKQRAVTP